MKTNSQGGEYTYGREVRWVYGVDLAVDKISNNFHGEKFTILDVGCGDGSFLHILKKRLELLNIPVSRIQYYGIDNFRGYRKSIVQAGGHFVLGDIMRMEELIGKLSFDLVVASEVIEHVDETDRLILSMKKLAKKDGLIYLTTPNLAAWHCRIMLLFGFQPLPTEVSNASALFGQGLLGERYHSDGKPIHHIRVFTLKAIQEFVRFHGFDIVNIFGCGYRVAENYIFRKIFLSLAPDIILILKKADK